MQRAVLSAIAVAATLATCQPVRAQSPPSVGIYADEEGSACNLVDDAPGIKAYYVILNAPAGATAVEFSAPKPDCFDATWLGDDPVFPLVLGNSQDGIAISFQYCYPSPLHVLTLQYYVNGTTGDCCGYPVLPRPSMANVQITDCSSNIQIVVGLTSYVNGNESCPCGALLLPPPSNPSPPDEAGNVPVVTALSWSRPETFVPLLYDVYFGTSTTPTLVSSNQSDTTFTPDILRFGVSYRWQVVARDTFGNVSPGPVWRFQTRGVSGERLVVSSDENHCEGGTVDTVAIDVTVENSLIDIDNGGFSVAFDPDILEYVGWDRGELIETWDEFTCVDDGDRVHLDGETSGAPIAEGASGHLARLTFVSLCCGVSHEIVSHVTPFGATGDFRALYPVGGTYTCRADTFEVAADGSGDAPTIQNAIDMASNADLILLRDGVFSGPGNRDIDYGGRRIRVRSISDNPAACIVDCEGSATDPHRGFVFDSGEDTEVVLRGVTIANGYTTDSGAAVRITGASPSIENCIVTNARVDGDGTAGGAIYVGPGGTAGYSAPRIQDCTIVAPNTCGVRIDDDAVDGPSQNPVLNGVEVRYAEGNGVELGDTASVSGLFIYACHATGVVASMSSPLTIATSTIAGCREGALRSQGTIHMIQTTVVVNFDTGPGPAVMHSSGADLSFTDCLLAFNHVNLFGDVGGVAIACSDVYGNSGGDYVGPLEGKLGESGNISIDPEFANLEYEITISSPCYMTHNPCGHSIGAGGIGSPRLYTISSNDDASGDFASIQQAIDLAPGSPGTLSRTFHLLDGTYVGPGNSDVDFLGKSIVLESQSQSAAAAVIDCEGAGRGIHVDAPGATVRHLTVRNGRADFGGGILAESGPGIEHVVVEACSASCGGGIFYTGASVHLDDAEVSGCTAADSAGGIYAAADSAGTVTGCAVSECIAGGPGGGILARNADVSDCTVTDASAATGDGGGMSVGGGEIANCTVRRSSAHDGKGGGILARSSPSVEHVVVTACSASSGGAIFYTGASVQLGEAEVSGCTAADSAGGIYAAADSAGTVTGCTVSECTAGGPGGGILARNADVSNCTVTFATAATGDGGGVYSTSDVTGCQVRACTAGGDGGGLWLGTGELTSSGVKDNSAAGNGGGAFVAGRRVAHCTVARNTSGGGGGGVWAADTVALDSVYVYDNTAGTDGGGLRAPRFTLFGSLIHSNGAVSGGGVWGDGSVEHCTIADNSASEHGGGLYITGTTVVQTSIISGSTSGEAVYCESGTAQLSCTDVYGNDGGDFSGCVAGQDSLNGNFSLDPLYDNAAGGDYTLARNSPCLASNNDCGTEIGYALSVIAAEIQVYPLTFAFGIPATIELPPPLTPGDIDLTGLMLRSGDREPVPLLTHDTQVLDSDGDGILETLVYFDRPAFQQNVPSGESVPLHIDGEVGGTWVSGYNTVTFYYVGIARPWLDENVTPGETITVVWNTAGGANSTSAAVFLTRDEGDRWEFLGQVSSDVGSLQWTVPDSYYECTCRILVIADRDGSAVGMGMSQVPFRIGCGYIATALQNVNLTVEDGTAVICWGTSQEDGLAGFRVMRSRSKDGDYTAVGGVIAPRGAGASYEFRDTGIRANEETWYRITAAESDGTESVLWTESVTYRLTFSLEQNHPNPFNPTTTIGFSLPEATQVELDIYDVSGRRVRTLVDGRREAKRYAVEWDGRDDGGTRVASGIYFYRIVAGRHVETKKMVLLK
jgi:hypothetical protein